MIRRVSLGGYSVKNNIEKVLHAFDHGGVAAEGPWTGNAANGTS
jgi:hypothetical protein